MADMMCFYRDFEPKEKVGQTTFSKVRTVNKNGIHKVDIKCDHCGIPKTIWDRATWDDYASGNRRCVCCHARLVKA